MNWDDGDGGFINDTATADPQQVNSSVIAGGDDKNKAITAVSVAQIVKLTRPNEGLMIHGKKVYHVNLVASVYEIIDVSPQKIHVLVDDFTSSGPLEVHHIIGDSGSAGEDPSLSMFSEEANADHDQPKPLHALRTGDYIRCIGVVKFNQDKSNFVAYNMKIVTDPNEVTVHTLEVIRDSLYLEKGPAVAAAPITLDSRPTGAAKTASTANEFGNLSTREKHILKFLKENAPGKGVRVEEISKNFKAFSVSEIHESLELLNSEGQCWQGDDEDTWRVD